MQKTPIRIIDLDFNLYGEIDNYESLQITRKWHSIGDIELRINRYMQHTKELKRGRIIFPFNHLNKGYIIRTKEIELDENGKVTENWVIQALPLKSWLSQRLTYPPSHTAYDNKQGDAESVMQHYVTNNAVDPADTKRKIPNLVLADNKHRGENISWQSRYKDLSEDLENISEQSGLGWNIIVDYENKRFVFDVQEGRNLSAYQSDLPPVIFSPEYDSLGNMSYTESDLEYKNYAVVAGQGEGVDRRIIMTGDDDANGFDRYELFVDARDVEEEKDSGDESGEPTPRPVEEIERDLTNRGNQKLAEHEQEIFMEGMPLQKSPFVYERDYDLGDIVTLQNKGWGITMDARITEAKEIYESSGKKVELTFGNDKPTLISKIKQGFRNFDAEMKK